MCVVSLYVSGQSIEDGKQTEHLNYKRTEVENIQVVSGFCRCNISAKEVDVTKRMENTQKFIASTINGLK